MQVILPLLVPHSVTALGFFMLSYQQLNPAPHVVLTGGGVGWGEREIRNQEFSDLPEEKERLM